MSELNIHIADIMHCPIDTFDSAKDLLENAFAIRRMRVVKAFRASNPILGWTLCEDRYNGEYKGFSNTYQGIMALVSEEDEYKHLCNPTAIYNPELKEYLEEALEYDITYFNPALNTYDGKIDQDAYKLKIY